MSPAMGRGFVDVQILKKANWPYLLKRVQYVDIYINLLSSLCTRKDWHNYVRVIKPSITRYNMFFFCFVFFFPINSNFDYTK